MDAWWSCFKMEFGYSEPDRSSKAQKPVIESDIKTSPALRSNAGEVFL